jgi:hypothetical protein
MQAARWEPNLAGCMLPRSFCVLFLLILSSACFFPLPREREREREREEPQIQCYYTFCFFGFLQREEPNFIYFLKNRSALSSISRCSPKHNRPTTGTATVGFSSSAAKSKQNSQAGGEKTHTHTHKRARERERRDDRWVGFYLSTCHYWIRCL